MSQKATETAKPATEIRKDQNSHLSRRSFCLKQPWFKRANSRCISSKLAGCSRCSIYPSMIVSAFIENSHLLRGRRTPSAASAATANAPVPAPLHPVSVPLSRAVDPRKVAVTERAANKMPVRVRSPSRTLACCVRALRDSLYAKALRGSPCPCSIGGTIASRPAEGAQAVCRLREPGDRQSRDGGARRWSARHPCPNSCAGPPHAVSRRRAF